MTARIWHAGKPPHIGWWNASVEGDLTAWRWWDGNHWSESAYKESHKSVVIACAALPRQPPFFQIEWSYYWPENARVPRVNPETGEVTGGKNEHR